MLTLYRAEQDRLCIIPRDALKEEVALVWIDLLNPSEEEELWVEGLLKIDIPTRAEMHEIELSNRFYHENGALYATASIISGADTNMPEIHAVTFVLVDQCLVTVRYSTPSFFKAFGERIQKGGYPQCRGSMVFAGLMEAIVNRIADVLESIGHQIDAIGSSVFRPDPQKMSTSGSEPDFAELLRMIGMNGDLISKVRESLISVSRLASFIASSTYYDVGSLEHAKMETLRHDVPALSDHAGFLSNKVSFLLDATLGMVNIQQNTIIKIFSVVSVVFLPPTLVASIYGMNFSAMPELHWEFGYPMAVVFMILSAFLPYLFFRKKGWL
ncbi:MAG TPA: magnesium transporter CorA family protein [Rickettsiales bacterium]|nr:magnesium transporter CorA family protein [Rickettsiales bacterium]